MCRDGRLCFSFDVVDPRELSSSQIASLDIESLFGEVFERDFSGSKALGGLLELMSVHLALVEIAGNWRPSTSRCLKYNTGQIL